MSGKWHLGEQYLKTSGFDVLDHLFVGGAGSYFPSSRLGEKPTWTYRTDEIGDRAAHFVRESVAEDKPFFLYWIPTAPHWPYDVLEDDLAQHRGRYDAGPQAVWRARIQRMREMGILKAHWPTPELATLKDATPGRHARFRTDKQREHTPPATYAGWMEAHAALMTAVDRTVGRMTETLKQTGQLDNTLFLFLSDNGAANEAQGFGTAWTTVSNAPFRYWKTHAYSGGATTCAIAHWPAGMKARPNSINHDPCHIVDLMPTCLEAAGITRPDIDQQGRTIPAPEGVSLIPTLNARPLPKRPPIGLEHMGNYGLIDGDWKLAAIPLPKDAGHTVELFNIADDRAESNNLAKAEPQRLERMQTQWNDWAKRVDATPGRK